MIKKNISSLIVYWGNHVNLDPWEPDITKHNSLMQNFWLVLLFWIMSYRSKPSLAAVVGCMTPCMLGVCFLCPSMDCLWHKYHYCPHCNEKVYTHSNSFYLNIMHFIQRTSYNIYFRCSLLILRKMTRVWWWIRQVGVNLVLHCLHNHGVYVTLMLNLLLCYKFRVKVKYPSIKT